MNKTHKVRGSFATYKVPDDTTADCDLDELARILINWGEIPKSLNDTRAFEIALLASAYLRLRKASDGKR